MMLQKTLIRSAARLIMICASVSICLFSLLSAGEEGIGVTRVGFVEGTASLKHKGTGYWVRLSEDQVVRAWDEIGTGGDGSVELLLPDESVVKVGPNTHVLVKEAGMVEVTKRATNIFELFVGEIRAVVAPLVIPSRSLPSRRKTRPSGYAGNGLRRLPRSDDKGDRRAV